MIVWHENVKKSENIINAVINQLYKDQINTDGVVEIFNNGKEQGCVLKLFDKFNPNVDLCIWVYLPRDRKINNHMDVIVGKHINCNNINMWEGADLKSYSFKEAQAREMHNRTRDFIVDFITKNLEKTYDIPRI